MSPCLASLAFMFSLVGSFWCQSIVFSTDGTWPGTIDFVPSDFKLGPWYQQETVLQSRTNIDGMTNYFVRDVCSDFSGSVDIDSKWKAVRAFSIITPILAGLLTGLLFFNNCSYYLSERSWNIVMLMFLILIPLFQGLSFLLLDSNACNLNPLLNANPSPDTVDASTWVEWISAAYPNGDCSWDTGMSLNVAATVLYFVTALCMKWAGNPRPPPVEPPQTQEVTYERQVAPDGTVKVVEANVIKGTAVPAAAPPETSEVPISNP
jgi:hypothetical protein